MGLFSKSHAAGLRGLCRGLQRWFTPGCKALRRSLCHRPSAQCSIAAQGFPLVLVLFAHIAQAACEGPAPAWVALGADVWLLQGEAGEASAVNRGHVANQVLARDGRRLWLLGAGATPRAARSLGCRPGRVPVHRAPRAR